MAIDGGGVKTSLAKDLTRNAKAKIDIPRCLAGVRREGLGDESQEVSEHESRIYLHLVLVFSIGTRSYGLGL